MVVRYTSEVPANPELDYVFLDPEMNSRQSFVDYVRANSEQVSAEIREALHEVLNPGTTAKPPYTYDRDYFQWSGAQSYIASQAVYDGNGRFDIDQTSRKIGIPYSYADLGHTLADISGLPGHPWNYRSPYDYPINMMIQMYLLAMRLVTISTASLWARKF